jgi:hypothetical protein
MTRAATIMAGLLLFYPGLCLADAPCLRYAENLILHGLLVTGKGPPRNLEYFEPGEKPGTTFFLRLRQPVCLTALGDEYNVARSSVREIELFGDEERLRSYHRLAGERVIFHGKLWARTRGVEQRDVVADSPELVADR